MDLHVFKKTPMLPTYTFSLVAGPFHYFTSSIGGLELGIYCRDSMAKALKGETLLIITNEGIKFF